MTRSNPGGGKCVPLTRRSFIAAACPASLVSGKEPSFADRLLPAPRHGGFRMDDYMLDDEKQ